MDRVGLSTPARVQTAGATSSLTWTSSSVLGSLVPLLTRRSQEHSQRRFGMVVAHDQLLKHLLLGEVVSDAHIFASSVLPRAFAAERGPCEAAIDEAFPSGRRPQFRPLTDLPIQAANHRYCFLSTGAETHRLGQMRWALQDHGHAIVTVVHAVNWMDAVANHLGMAVTSEEQDVIVTTSRAAESAVRCLHAWAAEVLGVTVRAEIVRIPFGVELPPEPAPGKIASRNALGLRHDLDILLYVGRLSDEYKADLAPAVIVLAALRDKYPSLHFVAAGHDQGHYGDRIRALARSLGVGSRVTVIEDAAEPIKELLLDAADVFVSPVDNIQESFGLALLEAMVHRLPVIASDWSGYRDIVVDGQSGFLIPTRWSPSAGEAASMMAPLDVTYGVPHLLARHSIVDVDALRIRVDQLVGNPVLRRTMGDQGRARATSEFGWPAIIGRYRDLITQSSARSRPAGRSRGRPLSFNAVFSHYASAPLDDDTWVVRGHGEPFATIAGASGAVWTRILALENIPRRWLELQGIVDGANESTLIELLKDGRLRLAEPPPL